MSNTKNAIFMMDNDGVTEVLVVRQEVNHKVNIYQVTVYIYNFMLLHK